MIRAMVAAVALILAAAPVSAEPTSFPGQETVVVSAGNDSLTLDSTRLEQFAKTSKLVKSFSKDGRYRASYDVEGVGLRAIIEQLGPKKRVPDGFDRELDQYVLVKGRDGKQAIFSYGELFLSGEETAVLADKLRPFIPKKHPAVPQAKWDLRAFLTREVRQHVDVTSCAACHQGADLPAIEIPKGLCLVPLRDRNGARWIDDVVEIRLKQGGLAIAKGAPDTSSAGGLKVILPDGRTAPLSREEVAKQPEIQWEDIAVGLGRGSHGPHVWEGKGLSAVLAPMLGSKVDTGSLIVLVTANDGYRCLYSGGEIFAARDNVLLVDRQEGKPLPENEGPYRMLVKNDFFNLDRCMFALKEIRCIVLKP